LPLHKGIAAGYIVGLAAMVVHSFGTITFYIVRIMDPFWFLTGLVASLDAYYRSKPADAATATATGGD